MTRRFFGSIMVAGTAVMLIPARTGAQFAMPNVQAGPNAQRPPLTADVRTTVTSNTPHGSFTQSQTGKYWRSQDGRTRQDTSFGSVITDPKARTITQLNHATKEATIISMPSAVTPQMPPTMSLGQRRPEPLAGQAVEDLGERKIAGYLAHGRRTVTKGDQVLQFGLVTTEVWTAAEIQLPLYIKQTSSHGESIQELENIRIGEPETAQFAVPAGYMVKESAGKLGSESRAAPASK